MVLYVLLGWLVAYGNFSNLYFLFGARTYGSLALVLGFCGLFAIQLTTTAYLVSWFVVAIIAYLAGYWLSVQGEYTID